MAGDENSGKYWPYMILGFLFIGITLGYWTVKHAIGLPVHESNEYMMKYQDADLDSNEIREAQMRFDRDYKVELLGMKPSKFKPKNLKRKAGTVVALNRSNTIRYRVTDRTGTPVDDANVTLLVTRPFTQKEDRLFALGRGKEGIYTSERITLKNPGRYILRVRVQKGDAVGFKDTEAYLQPDSSQ